MQHFAVGNTIISSEVDFPELPLYSLLPEESITFSIQTQLAQPPKQQLLYHCMNDDDGSTWAKVYHSQEGYLIDFLNYAVFQILPKQRAIYCAPRGNVPEKTLRHLLLDQILPLVLSLDHETIVFHASGVLYEGSALGFVGASGAGKSTLAGTLVEQGAKFLTDDCLIVQKANGRVSSYPYYAGLRLWEDSVDFFPALLREQKPSPTIRRRSGPILEAFFLKSFSCNRSLSVPFFC